jgi:hypothetical protein
MPRSEDGTLNGTAVEEWYTHVIGAFDDLGIVTRPGEHLETWFKDAGFVDVHVQAYRIPWPKNRHLVRFLYPHGWVYADGINVNRKRLERGVSSSRNRRMRVRPWLF